MTSEFITRVEREKDEPYTVIFRTDDADKYKHIEDECRKMIGHAKPTVDAVPVVHGEWIYKNRHRKSYRRYTGVDDFGETHTITVLHETEGKEPYCPYCGAQAVESFQNYCPNCGAKMRTVTDCHTLDER